MWGRWESQQDSTLTIRICQTVDFGTCAAGDKQRLDAVSWPVPDYQGRLQVATTGLL